MTERTIHDPVILDFDKIEFGFLLRKEMGVGNVLYVET